MSRPREAPEIEAMDWRPIKAEDITRDLLLFDGDCVMCSRWARFIHRRDPAQRIRFVMLQSPEGEALVRRFGIDPGDPASNLFIRRGFAFFTSDSGLEVLAALPGWAWTRSFAGAAARLAQLVLRSHRAQSVCVVWAADLCALDEFGLRDRIDAGRDA